jgi:WD40 repeat protein
MTADGCPGHNTLADLLLGVLSPEHEDVVLRHLEGCTACDALARELEAQGDPLIEALRRPLVDRGATTRGDGRPAAPQSPDSIRLEGFHILGEIGRGGMGVVYRAVQYRLNRIVAIKMILTGQLAGPEERVRFLMEGAILARLSHPNFVQVHEVGTVEVSPGAVQPYLVLEHVDGGSLKKKLGGKPLAAMEAAALMLILARAVEVAHAQGIVHRDLKPANVLIAADGALKITDFGLAKEVGGGASLTPTGATVGTPHYMAPEQARGRTDVGPSVDIYALGAILFEMLAGRPPFVGDTPMAILLQVLDATPPPVRRLRAGVPRDLETICLKCLEKEPRQRYERAGQLADDLEAWLENKPIRARPAGNAERAVKWAARHPLPASLLAFLFLSLLVGTAVSTYFAVTAGKRADDAQNALDKEAEATRAERWERYVANISAASNAMQLHNMEPARRALEAAPEEHRNWEWRHLQSQLDGARAVLPSGNGEVWGLSFSPDGKRLATSSQDGFVRIWDTATGTEERALRVPDGDLAGCAFNLDGTQIVTGGNMARMWEVSTGRLLWKAPIKARAFCPLWSPNGRWLAGVDADDWLRVRDAADGRELFSRPSTHFHPAVTFSPDSRLVAVHNQHRVGLWELPGGKAYRELSGHEEGITTVAFSPDGRRIATSSIYPENQVRLWNAADGHEIATMKGHSNEIKTLTFSPDGRRLASGSMDQTVRLWDAVTGDELATIKGHNGYVNVIAFSPDGKRLISASNDQTVRMWDTDRFRPIAVMHGHTGPVLALKYDAAGGVIASASADGTTRLWDADIVARSGVIRGHEDFIYDVAAGRGVRAGEVASASWDRTVRRWDVTTGRPVGKSFHVDTRVVSALAYSPDGRRLAATIREEGVRLWDLETGAELHTWPGGGGDARSDNHVAFTPAGTILAAGSAAGPVRLWDTQAYKSLGLLEGHHGASIDVVFRPDGNELASAGADGFVRLWNVAARRQSGALEGSPDTHRLAYSADGRLLAAGSTRDVRVWSLENPDQVRVLGLGAVVYGVAFNRDGTRLACACADNTIRLLDVPRMRQVAELRGHEEYVHSVTFTPDGTRLVSASGDKTLRVWDTLPAQTRATAR